MMELRAMAERAAEELGRAAQSVDPEALDGLVAEIAAARRVVAYGVGREGLMMRALAMRLYHLGLDAMWSVT
jgi:6-phospho-3-hexuloisomerase